MNTNTKERGTMITIEDLKFELHLKTNAGTLVLPSLEREENYDGHDNLSVSFSHFYGIRVKDYFVRVFVGSSLSNVVTDVVPDYFDHMAGQEIGECDCSAIVELTPKHLKKVTATLNAKAKPKAKRKRAVA